MNGTTITLPASVLDYRDVIFAAVPGTIPAPDFVTYEPQARALTVAYNGAGLTATQVTNLQALAATNPQPANAPWRIVANDLARLSGIATVLRNQAQVAAGTTVTSGNAVAVLQTVVNDLAIFCARLADLIEALNAG